MGTAQAGKNKCDTGLIDRDDPKLLKTREHYDTYPYEVDVQNNRIYRSTQSHIGRFAFKIKGGSALDVGYGPGNLLPVLGGRASYTDGFDLSQKSLDHAAGTVGDLPIELLRASALDLPHPNESFDFVVATGSLHHTPDAGRRSPSCGGSCDPMVRRSSPCMRQPATTLSSITRWAPWLKFASGFD